MQLPHILELNITKWEVALSEIQFPNNFYTIWEGYNTIIKLCISPSTEELNNLHSNIESEKQKQEVEKMEDTALPRDYLYQELIEVVPSVYDNMEQTQISTSKLWTKKYSRRCLFLSPYNTKEFV